MDHRLKPTSHKYIVGWFTRRGESRLSTWVGETDYFILMIPPEKYNGHLWDHSPKSEFYEFTEDISFEDQLKIANEVNGTLVIAFTQKDQ